MATKPYPSVEDVLFNGPKGAFILFDYISSALAILAICLVLRAAFQSRFDLVGYKTCLISHLISGLWLSTVNWLFFVYQGVVMPSVVADNSTFAKCGADFLRSLQLVGYFANLFNLAAMSTDHYVGILHPIQYPKFAMSAGKIVFSIWVVSALLGFADYPVTTALYLMAASNGHNKVNGSALKTLNQNLKTLGVLNPNDRQNNGKIKLTSGSPQYDFDNLALKDLENIIDALVENDGDSKSVEQRVIESNISQAQVFLLFNLTDANLKVYPAYQEKVEISWCWHHSRGKAVLEIAVMSLTLFCLIMLIVCYSKIFREVRVVVVNISSKTVRKFISTTCLLLAAFVLSWAPFMGIELFMIILMNWVCQPSNQSECTLPINNASEYKFFYAIHNAFNTAIIIYPLFVALIYTTRIAVIRKRVLWQFVICLPCVRPYVQRLMTSQRRSSAHLNAYKIQRRSSFGDDDHDKACNSSTEKRQAIHQELLPFIYRVGLLHNPNNQGHPGSGSSNSNKNSSKNPDGKATKTVCDNSGNNKCVVCSNSNPLSHVTKLVVELSCDDA